MTVSAPETPVVPLELPSRVYRSYALGLLMLIYVVNFNSNSIQGYMIDNATGAPASVASAFNKGVGSGPTCVAIDPALGTNLYTSDSSGDTISAAKVQVNTGDLTGVQNSPFLASGQPTCLAIVPNGSHATQIIQP